MKRDDLDLAVMARAARQGDSESLDRWLRTEHPRVWRLCLGCLADRTEADDAAQDAMLKLTDALQTWDPERAYEPWRNAVVVRLCRDRIRRRSVRQDAEHRAASEALPQVLPDPGDRAQADEVRAALTAALARLTPREREVFVLRELEGEATGCVAESLGITESSVRSLLTLARRRLRGLLEKPLTGSQSS